MITGSSIRKALSLIASSTLTVTQKHELEIQVDLIADRIAVQECTQDDEFNFSEIEGYLMISQPIDQTGANGGWKKTPSETACSECGAVLRPYYLKNGVYLIVTAVVAQGSLF
jgi:hypothetical protein